LRVRVVRGLHRDRHESRLFDKRPVRAIRLATRAPAVRSRTPGYRRSFAATSDATDAAQAEVCHEFGRPIFCAAFRAPVRRAEDGLLIQPSTLQLISVDTESAILEYFDQSAKGG